MGHPCRLSPAGERGSSPAAAPLARLPLARDGLSSPGRESAEEGPLRNELARRVHLGKPDHSCSRFKGASGVPCAPSGPFPKRFSAASVPRALLSRPGGAACAGPASGLQADAFLITNGSKQIGFFFLKRQVFFLIFFYPRLFSPHLRK